MTAWKASAGLFGIMLAATGAFAADMPLIEDSTPFEAPPAARYWDGFYIGAFGGWLGNNTTVYNEPPVNEKQFTGWLAGGQAGLNAYLSDQIVAGVVGDIAWVNAGGVTVPGVEFAPKWQASVRGKLGFDAGNVLPYLTGGFAVLNSALTTQFSTDSKTHTGWTAGGGVDVAITQNIFLTGEYRYSSYGQVTFDNQQDPVGLHTHQATLGMNLKF